MVIPNDFRAAVSDQGKIDLLAIREVFQDRFGIIANRNEPDALFFKARFCSLQLDQLRFAVGSPIS